MTDFLAIHPTGALLTISTYVCHGESPLVKVAFLFCFCFIIYFFVLENCHSRGHQWLGVWYIRFRHQSHHPSSTSLYQISSPLQPPPHLSFNLTGSTGQRFCGHRLDLMLSVLLSLCSGERAVPLSQTPVKRKPNLRSPITPPSPLPTLRSFLLCLSPC